MQIFDSHQQLWHPEKFYYSWLQDKPDLKRPFLATDMPREGNGWTLNGSLVVEGRCLPEQGIQEARWLNGVAAEQVCIHGVIAYAPLENHNFHAYLEVIQKDAPHVRGVRRPLLGKDADLMQREHFLDAVRVLPDYDYTFDLAIDSSQLARAANIAQHAPQTRIIIDHLGRPDVQHESFEAWHYGLRTLSAYDNVFCKLSVPVLDETVSPSLSVIRQYIEAAVTLFGVERVLFASNFPRMQAIGLTYDAWVKAVLQVVEQRGKDAVQKVFHDNARTVYNITDEDES